MAYVVKGERITNNCLMSREAWNWAARLFSSLLGQIVLNSHIILSPWDNKLDDWKFRLTSVQIFGNVCKGPSYSIHSKKRTNSTSQSNVPLWTPTHGSLASCRIALGVCVLSQEIKHLSNFVILNEKSACNRRVCTYFPYERIFLKHEFHHNTARNTFTEI
jgi:hypothetical protein